MRGNATHNRVSSYRHTSICYDEQPRRHWQVNPRRCPSQTIYTSTGSYHRLTHARTAPGPAPVQSPVLQRAGQPGNRIRLVTNSTESERDRTVIVSVTTAWTKRPAGTIGCHNKATRHTADAAGLQHLSWKRFGKSQIPLRYPGRRQVRGWSHTCSELEFGLSCTI